MAALSNEVKMFIVQALACYDQPSEVARRVKAEFGLDVVRQQVETYDPTARAGRDLSKKWRELFEETRKVFIEDTTQVAISHRAVRLRALNRMAVKAEEKGNMALAAQLLEQAAKEVGESYTNRFKHELTGRDGGPIETRKAKDLTDEELAAIAAGGGAGTSH